MPDKIKPLIRHSNMKEIPLFERHKFFIHCCYQYTEEAYIIYMCMQQYVDSPSKRKMIFMHDNFFYVETSASTSANLPVASTSLIGSANLGGVQLLEYKKGMQPKVNVAKALKTFEQKKAFLGGGALGAAKAIAVKNLSPDPQAFSFLQSEVEAMLTSAVQTYKPEVKLMPKAEIQNKVAETKRLLSNATFSPLLMGIW